ncbi:MAG: hypothetical protein FJ276_24235 [Planctomycetes bacterium]|nr:hypothetical protein [Planctomycetota bacterium]
METHATECLARQTAAAVELSQQEPTVAAELVTRSLVDGLNLLRNIMFTRIHEDVEANYGQDSMLLPVSVAESEHRAKTEIEAYQIAVAAATVRDRGYIKGDFRWFLNWLGHLRLGDLLNDNKWRRRIRHYLSMTEDEQRLSYSRNLEGVFPEASRAPLILYRLFPTSVSIVTAIAFGQHLEAAEMRNRQAFWLPAITDCRECHGRPLDNGEQCCVCSNPLWTYYWLSAD